MSFPVQEIVIRQIGEDDGLLIAFVEVRKRKKEKKENIIEDITSLDPLFLIRPPKIEENWLKINEHRWGENRAIKEEDEEKEEEK
ncbi:MAG: hypothetical protein Q6362_012520 [Candidatus Wukongarchaeota archaeon]|nr:hypothetical protein [Candidatus Wukongarchaeota archaeon]MDO8130233.1 hypothetical protein [Candidatus Wukongarchaeota archaeon]